MALGSVRKLDSNERTFGCVGFAVTLHVALFAVITLAPKLQLFPEGNVSGETIEFVALPQGQQLKTTSIAKKETDLKGQGKSSPIAKDLTPSASNPDDVIVAKAKPAKKKKIVKKSKSIKKNKITKKKTVKRKAAKKVAKFKPATVLPEKEPSPFEEQEKEMAAALALEKKMAEKASRDAEQAALTEQKRMDDQKSFEVEQQELEKQRIAKEEQRVREERFAKVNALNEKRREANARRVKEAKMLADSRRASDARRDADRQSLVNSTNSARNKVSNRGGRAGSSSQAYGVPSGARDVRDLKQAVGNVPPAYPTKSRRLKQQGKGEVVYFVTDAGRVSQIRMAKTTGHPLLDREAVRAISRYRFVPGQAGWTRHLVNFDLNGPAKQIDGRLRFRSSSSSQKRNYN